MENQPHDSWLKKWKLEVRMVPGELFQSKIIPFSFPGKAS
jgi:hypothetical protein